MKITAAVVLVLALSACAPEPVVPSAPPPAVEKAPPPKPETPKPVTCGCCWGMHLLPPSSCRECGAAAAFQEHKLCDACSARLYRCAHCGAPVAR